MSGYGVNHPNPTEYALYVKHDRVRAWLWYGTGPSGGEVTRTKGSSRRYLTREKATEEGDRLLETHPYISDYEIHEIVNPRAS